MLLNLKHNAQTETAKPSDEVGLKCTDAHTSLT